MTGRENTRFACRIQGLHSDEMEPIIDYVRAFADIGKYFDMPARVYSSGMRARLGFGITMAFDFDFYIIDELSAVGDSTFKNKAREIFQEKRLKAGFVRASHSFKELRAECSSGIVIHNSRLEYWPTIDEAIESYVRHTGVSDDSEVKRTARAAKQTKQKAARRPARDAAPSGKEPSGGDALGRATRPGKQKYRPGRVTGPAQQAG
jgi:ABC-type polysaccharide/polyol phosphate transport system ATPase subunit